MKPYRAYLALAAVLALFSSTSARADTIDMAALTCGELQSMSADEAGSIMLWMHGYFGGEAKDTVVDLKSFGAASRALGQYCAQNAKMTVMTAIKRMSR